jgi:hypothetical protein
VGNLFSEEESDMAKEEPTLIPPLVAAAAAAGAVGLLALLLLDQGVWNKPQVQSETMVQAATTGRAAQAAGATVTETPMSSSLAPVAPGAKQPATPDPAKTR